MPRQFPVDDAERRRRQDPEAILTSIGVRTGSVFVDVGCGDGFFAIPAARMVGSEGAVYGVDINRDAIGRLAERAAQEGLSHVRSIAGTAEETVVCQECADFVFYGIDLHDFQDQGRVLVNARRMLKPTGLLVDLDWKKAPMDFGPPLRIRFSEDEAAALIVAAGFEIESVKDVSQYHYLILARR
jgi:ubiquinone/menaquinone biosynthesis C-methylase UbiE